MVSNKHSSYFSEDSQGKKVQMKARLQALFGMSHHEKPSYSDIS